MRIMKTRQCKECGAIHWLDTNSFRRIKTYYRQVCRECEKEEKKWYRHMQKLGLAKIPPKQQGRIPVEELEEKYTKIFERMQVMGVDSYQVSAGRADKILAEMGLS